MVKRSGAGSLNCRITFQTRAEIDDGYGNTVAGDWADQFTTSARLQPIFTSALTVESVGQARLQSQQPYNLTVRSSASARAITPVAWRAYDARAGLNGKGEPKRVFNIKTIVNPDERNAYLEMLVVEGQAS